MGASNIQIQITEAGFTTIKFLTGAVITIFNWHIDNILVQNGVMEAVAIRQHS